MSRPPTPQGFEDVDRSGEATGCAAYLEVASQLAAARSYKEKALEHVAPHPALTVLEIGCGTGVDLASLAGKLGPSGKAVGLDASLHLLIQTRNRAQNNEAVRAPMPLFCADAHDLPFADATFDGCRADRILQHLEDPLGALRELGRVCRPEGRVVVSEPDWDSLVIDVGSNSDEERRLTRRVRDVRADAVRHGAIGSRLPRLFRTAGFEDVHVESHVLTVESPHLAEELLGLSAGALSAYERGDLEARDTARWVALLQSASRSGRLFCALTGFTVVGHLPTAPLGDIS